MILDNWCTILIHTILMTSITFQDWKTNIKDIGSCWRKKIKKYFLDLGLSNLVNSTSIYIVRDWPLMFFKVRMKVNINRSLGGNFICTKDYLVHPMERSCHVAWQRSKACLRKTFIWLCSVWNNNFNIISTANVPLKLFGARGLLGHSYHPLV